jgi:hypothetical protein
MSNPNGWPDDDALTIRTASLHKHYGPVAALAGVDLSVASGSRTADRRPVRLRQDHACCA